MEQAARRVRPWWIGDGLSNGISLWLFSVSLFSGPLCTICLEERWCELQEDCGARVVF